MNLGWGHTSVHSQCQVIKFCQIGLRFGGPHATVISPFFLLTQEPIFAPLGLIPSFSVEKACSKGLRGGDTHVPGGRNPGTHEKGGSCQRLTIWMCLWHW